MCFKHANKLLKREIERIKHSGLAIRLRDDTIVGDGYPLYYLEWMYARYRIDPFLGDRVVKAFKKATFDISFSNKDTHFEGIRLEFYHHSGWWLCDIYPVDSKGMWHGLPKAISVLDYITGEMTLSPCDDVSKKALKYLDQFIARSASDFMFRNDMWIPDDDVKRLKKEITDTFINLKEGENKNE